MATFMDAEVPFAYQLCRAMYRNKAKCSGGWEHTANGGNVFGYGITFSYSARNHYMSEGAIRTEHGDTIYYG